MAYKYSYGNMGNLFKNPAEVAGPICQKLKETVGLTPENLVKMSEKEDAPLHNEFEWNNDVAAEKWREEQASNIIRHLIIVRTDVTELPHYKDRAFVHSGIKEVGYLPLAEALTTEKWRANLLKAAYRDMEIFTAKYHRLEELSQIIDDMNQILGDDGA